MAVPHLTLEQRRAALEKAAAARKFRARIREQLKNKEISVNEIIERARTEESLAKMKVIALLEALPAVGKIKAAKFMEKAKIAESRRIKGLGEHQLSALIKEFGE
ncbi:MAG: integration host factor, actinobacterial type [Candidatus Nanopelagicales bacterium]